MTEDDYKLLAEAIHKEFANKPVPQSVTFETNSKLRLPQSWGGWLSLITLTSAVISFFVTTVIRINSVDMRIAENKAEISKHIHAVGVHQTPAEKALATVKTIQPIRDDLAQIRNTLELMSSRIKNLEKKIDEVDNRNNPYETNPH